MRATKLVCTLGPVTVERAPELIDAGMDVARINCSHGTRGDRDRMVKAVRDAEASAGRPIAVMADLAGPKVRLGELLDGAAAIEEGARFVLRHDGAPGDGTGASVSYRGLSADLERGDRVLLADGVVELRVVDTGEETVTEVMRGGVVRSRAGVNVPSERLSTPAIGSKDRDDLRWAVEAGCDLVAQSFVRRADDVEALRRTLGEDAPPIVAKIETSSAVSDAPKIVDAADAVMVARGDLGVEATLEDIPVIQKELVALARAAAVPSIVATQMLESMVHARRPTRAEVSDVAGAVFDGADAVMLSAETAVGDHPVEAARTAARIAGVAETRGARFLPAPPDVQAYPTDEHAVAEAAAEIARDGGAVALGCFTRTGRTAALLSAARPRVPILALSPDGLVVRRLSLQHGVVPRPSTVPDTTEDIVALLDRALRDAELAGPGDPTVMVASSPFGRARTNLLKLHRIGS